MSLLSGPSCLLGDGRPDGPWQCPRFSKEAWAPPSRPLQTSRSPPSGASSCWHVGAAADGGTGAGRRTVSPAAPAPPARGRGTLHLKRRSPRCLRKHLTRSVKPQTMPERVFEGGEETSREGRGMQEPRAELPRPRPEARAASTLGENTCRFATYKKIPKRNQMCFFVLCEDELVLLRRGSLRPEHLPTPWVAPSYLGPAAVTWAGRRLPGCCPVPRGAPAAPPRPPPAPAAEQPCDVVLHLPVSLRDTLSPA